MQRSSLLRLRAGLATALLCGFLLSAQTPPQPVVIAVGSQPYGVAIDPVTNIAVVGNTGDNTLAFVDLSKEVVANTAPMNSPAGIAINSKTGVVVVANTSTNQVTVLSLATRQVLGVINVGSSPVAVAINPVTNVAVVANSNGNSLSVIDLTTLTVTATITGIPNVTGLQAVAIHPGLNLAVAASSTANGVFLVDLAAKTFKQVSVEQSPNGVAIEPFTFTAVVTNQNSNSVSFVDLQAAKLTATVASIRQPLAVAVSTTLRIALVTTGANSTAEVVSLPTATDTLSITNLPSATGVAHNSVTGRTVVTLRSNNSLGIVRTLGLFTATNGGSYAAGPAAPLSIQSGFGYALGTSTANAQSLPLPTSMFGVSMKVGTSDAPLFFVSPAQINFQVPKLPPGTYPVSVLLNSQAVAAGSMTIAATQPGIFTVNQQGNGQAAALNGDNSLNGTGNETTTGGLVALFATGGGAFQNDPVEGTAASAATNTVAQATATIGGAAATVLYSGAAPGLVGVWQINLKVPGNITVGPAVPVIVTIGGQVSNTVTIAVR